LSFLVFDEGTMTIYAFHRASRAGRTDRTGHTFGAAVLLGILGVFFTPLALAKLPPASDEAKAKAAEAAAKTAHGNQVANFQLCKSMDRVAGVYFADGKKAAKDLKPAATTAPCADPGAFVYTPPVPAAPAAPGAAPAAVPAAAAAPALAAVPAAATATKK
jgi:hypothetical protein